MDRLTLFLSQFPVSTSVFHTGALPSASDFGTQDNLGHLHVFRSGKFSVYIHERPDITISEPTLLYCPKPVHHRLTPLTSELTDTSANDIGEVLCATVKFGENTNSAITESLPDIIALPLSQTPSLDQVLSLLFDEAAADHCGKQFAQDRLAEYFLVLLLRKLIDQKSVDSGLLAALADSRLAKLISSIQASPATQWTLEEMAFTAGMSRARFAAHFKELVGITPHQYLTDWRIMLAKNRLRRGEPLQTIADATGFSNTAALSRAFQQKVGISPKAWLKSP